MCCLLKEKEHDHAALEIRDVDENVISVRCYLKHEIFLIQT